MGIVPVTQYYAKFFRLDNLVSVEFGTFQLLSYINFTSGTEHPVFLCSFYYRYNNYGLQHTNY